MHHLVSYGKEDGMLDGPLQAINSLSAEDNCLPKYVAGSIVQNKTIFLEFSLKYADEAL